MIARLLYDLHDAVPVFNVFRYITFRAALAALTAFAIALLLGPWLVRRLKASQIGQSIREEGPSSHQAKKGTPTMGGILIIVAIVAATILWGDVPGPHLDVGHAAPGAGVVEAPPADVAAADASQTGQIARRPLESRGNTLVVIALATTLAFGGIGFLDDYQKVAKKRNLGLTARRKFMLQLVAAAGAGTWLVALAARGDFDTRLGVPFFKNFTPDLGAWYMPFAMLVIVGAANAVNLTDGLDGLAIGATAVCVATFTAVAYVVGHVEAAEYLGVHFVRDAGELTVFCAAVFGAALGFLWFNGPPAQVFMGDVGSMGLGGAIGVVAVCAKQEILLVIVGGLFVIEALSVIVQVASFKLTGRRVLKMAPLHHHFETKHRDVPSYFRGFDWAEPKIVVRFWIAAVLFALVGLSTLKLR